MLFDTLRRKNQAEQEEREWNANRPADYVSRNKDAMDSLTGQIGSGFDWDTGSKAYQQYRAQAQANAAASAENAQANAAMLAGGYGSSYADSVAKQGQQQALSGIDNAVPGLRGQALSEYQNQQNDLLSALSGMANTEALDRSAYGSNFANYTAWQNFLANQSEQARNENDNYWNNLWNRLHCCPARTSSAGWPLLPDFRLPPEKPRCSEHQPDRPGSPVRRCSWQKRLRSGRTGSARRWPHPRLPGCTG